MLLHLIKKECIDNEANSNLLDNNISKNINAYIIN